MYYFLLTGLLSRATLWTTQILICLLVSLIQTVQAADPNTSNNKVPRTYKVAAVAQIRFPEKKRALMKPINPPPIVSNPPIVSPPVVPEPVVINNPTSNPISNPPIIVDQFDLILNLIPNSKLGIFYDSSKPITVNNPVRVYNTRSGGYSSVYFDKDGFLQISLGVVPNEFNDIKPLGPNSTIDPNSLSFTETATLSTFYSESEVDLSSAKTGNSTVLSIDTLPRVNKRYGIVTKSFITASGIIVPQGSVVVGTRKDGLEKIHRPEFGEFENLRFYSPEGVLINIAGNQSKQDIDCGLGKSAACMDFERFYTPIGTKEFGAKVAATYNPRQFFTGKSAKEANDIWLKIQKDLEANTVLDINSANETWLSRIFKDLNEQEQVYIGNLLNNLSRTEFLRKLFAYDPNTVQKDSTAKTLYDKQFDALYDFTKAKQDIWEAKTQIEIDKAVTIKNKAKVLFENTRDEYIQYMKKGEEDAKPATSTIKVTGTTVTTTTNTNQQTSSKTSTPALKEEPKKNNGKKKK